MLMMRKKKMMMMMRKRKRKSSCVMQREATHVQSMCQAGAKNAMGLDAAVELARKTAEASVRTESQRPSLKKRQKLMCVKK